MVTHGVVNNMYGVIFCQTMTVCITQSYEKYQWYLCQDSVWLMTVNCTVKGNKMSGKTLSCYDCVCDCVFHYHRKSSP